MSNISIGLPSDPREIGFVTAEQLAAVNAGCKATLQGLGDLAAFVKVFRVNFIRLGDKDTCGPHFHIVFEDPLGTECSHSTDYRFIGVREQGKDGSPYPSEKDIVDHLTKDSGLPRFIRAHLARGVKRLASVNATFKRVSIVEGFSLAFIDDFYSPHLFRASSNDAALQHVANHLKIPYPMTAESFREAGGSVVYRKFNVPFFPLYKK